MAIHPMTRLLLPALCFCIVFVACFPLHAFAEGIVSKVTGSPLYANGIVRDHRSGIYIHLQTDQVQGPAFMNPAVLGYGIPPGGRLEVELVSGFQRDPDIPLDGGTILLVVGSPQQGLSRKASGFTVSEGDNRNTFVIAPSGPDGLQPEKLVSVAPGASRDPVPQRGIKILHVGRKSAFVSRGKTGVVEVRFRDSGGNVFARGRASINFLAKPVPQILPTNIPHDQRNHDWQRLGPGQVVGVANNTLPVPFLLFAKNKELGNEGINGAGVLSTEQLALMKYKMPKSLARYDGGLILTDTNGDGFLDPKKDTIIGGMKIEAPKGSRGYQAVTPLVGEKLFLSVPTGEFNTRAGTNIGGSIMQVVFIAGDKKGIYRPTFSLLSSPGDTTSPDGSSVTYSIVVE